ncbi:DJ-1/PfpI family protein [Spirochaetota bacterium]
MKTVCVILADACEEVEAITPIDWLRRAGLSVSIAGLNKREVKGVHDIVIGADVLLDNIDNSNFDCIVIPGGKGAEAIAKNPVAIAMIKRLSSRGSLIAAICAAPALVLGQACGLLKGRRFTCYPGMENLVPEGRFEASRVVADGDLITARGPGCAVEFSLAIVQALLGASKAKELASQTLSLGF